MFGQKTPRGETRFEGARVGYAVGDIHGRADLLARLIGRLEQEPATQEPPVLIFLGDYVDRGPDSCGVIDLLLEPRPNGFERRFLLGNHESAMLSFLDNPERYRDWLRHGGVTTLISYGVAPPRQGAPGEAIQETAAQLRARMPAAHLEFFQRLDRFTIYGGYAFVHAGIDPDKSFDAQTDLDLLWSREKFIKSRRTHEYMIVHGHTPVERPHRDHRRIGIDTGAYATGRLTAVKLHGADVEFISIGPN